MYSLKQTFDGPDGCVDKCKPENIQKPSEQGIRESVNCVLECSTTAVQCFADEGITKDDLRDGIVGMIAAFTMDGCRLAATIESCPKPTQWRLLAAMNGKDASDPCALPKAPVMTTEDKQSFCSFLTCSTNEIYNNAACSRAADSLAYQWGMIMEWLEC